MFLKVFGICLRVSKRLITHEFTNHGPVPRPNNPSFNKITKSFKIQGGDSFNLHTHSQANRLTVLL